MYNDPLIKYSTKYLPLEYKLLELKLIINKELYEEKIIDFKVYRVMEQNIVSKMNKIKNSNNVLI